MKYLILSLAVIAVGLGLSRFALDESPSKDRITRTERSGDGETRRETTPLGKTAARSGSSPSKPAALEEPGVSQGALGDASQDRESEGKPLPYSTTVHRVVVDEETGEVEIRMPSNPIIARGDLPDRGLPEPAAQETKPNATTESSRALDGMALEALKRGDLVSAMEFFEEAIKSDPNDVRARSDYGRMLTLMAAYDKAYVQLERAAELNPDDPSVWLALHNLYERDYRSERGSDALDKAIERAGGDIFVKDNQQLLVMPGF